MTTRHKVCPQVKATISALTLEDTRRLALRLNDLHRQGVRFTDEQLHTIEALKAHLDMLKRVDDARNPRIAGAISLLLSSLTFDLPIDEPTTAQLDRMCRHFGVDPKQARHLVK